MIPLLGRNLRGQQPVLAITLLVTVIAGGTLGYVVIEGWGVWDSFYMAVITVTTVGYREVHPLSRMGEAFTVVLLTGGVGTALYAFTLLATIVVEGGLHKRFQDRRRTRMLDTIKDHFILCGYGRIGSMVAQQFARQKVPFVVIDLDPERVHVAMEQGFLAVVADASNEDVLRRVGIERARGLIAAVSTDAENVYAILTARVLGPNLFIVGRSETEDGSRKLVRAGANRVVTPYQIGAIQMAQTAIRPAVVDFVQLATSSENLELAIEEILISQQSTLANQSILDANLRQRFGVIVVGIQRPDLHIDFNPEPDTAIRAGDKLVVLGRPHSLKRLEVEAAAG